MSGVYEDMGGMSAWGASRLRHGVAHLGWDVDRVWEQCGA